MPAVVAVNVPELVKVCILYPPTVVTVPPLPTAGDPGAADDISSQSVPLLTYTSVSSVL
jgi:hypothetical protein